MLFSVHMGNLSPVEVDKLKKQNQNAGKCSCICIVGDQRSFVDFTYKRGGGGGVGAGRKRQGVRTSCFPYLALRPSRIFLGAYLFAKNSGNFGLNSNGNWVRQSSGNSVRKLWSTFLYSSTERRKFPCQLLKFFIPTPALVRLAYPPPPPPVNTS